jgi:acetoin utilization protein AcuB
MTTVDQLMTRAVVTIEPDASGHEAVSSMVRNKIRHLAVVDRSGRLCGVVTDRDLRHRLFTPEVFRAVGSVPVERLLSNVRVRDVMSAPVVSVGTGAALEEAARLMANNKLGALLVVDHGQIAGIITETDVLRAIVGADACCSDVETIVVSYP